MQHRLRRFPVHLPGHLQEQSRLTQELESQRSTTAAAEARAASLQTELTRLQAERAASTTALAAEEGRVAALTAEQARLQGDLERLRADCGDSAGHAARLEGERAAAEGRVAQLTREAATADAERCRLLQEVAALEAAAAELRSRLAAVEAAGCAAADEATAAARAARHEKLLLSQVSSPYSWCFCEPSYAGAQLGAPGRDSVSLRRTANLPLECLARSVKFGTVPRHLLAGYQPVHSTVDNQWSVLWAPDFHVVSSAFLALMHPGIVQERDGYKAQMEALRDKVSSLSRQVATSGDDLQPDTPAQCSSGALVRRCS